MEKIQTIEDKDSKTFLDIAEKGASIYQGSHKTRRFAVQVADLLQKCIQRGDDLRFRDIADVYKAFDHGKCVYALNASGHIVGFTYIRTYEAGRKKCVEKCSLVVDPSYRYQKIGKRIIQIVFDIVKEKYPDRDLLSMSSNPIVIRSNQKEGFKEISYRELWEQYGLSIIEICENYPNLSIRSEKSSASQNLFDNLKVIHIPTGNLKRIFSREA